MTSDEDIPVYFNPDSNSLETVYLVTCKNLEGWSIESSFVVSQVITALGIFSKALSTRSSGQSRTHFYSLLFSGAFG